MAYKFTTGLWKSLKNTFVVGVVPAIVFLLANYNQFLDRQTAVELAPFLGFLSYLLKNYLENK